MKKTTLIVMAAGMGSRYGGLKQIDPVGPSGEIILDYSVFDAAEAGFDKVIFVIKHEIEEDFKNITEGRYDDKIEVEYAFQDMNDLPEGFTVPEGRVKPWGTGHAILCAREFLNEPFATINADDFYGAESFKIMHDQLVSSDEICMVGYKLGNTLSDKGDVSRGICETKDGYLTSITENTALNKDSGIPLDTTVSMNMWGYQPFIWDYVEKYFDAFLENVPNTPNPLKAEFYLPTITDKLIKDGYNCRVLQTNEKWYGVTYKDDADEVRAALSDLTNKGCYPKEKRVND